MTPPWCSAPSRSARDHAACARGAHHRRSRGGAGRLARSGCFPPDGDRTVRDVCGSHGTALNRLAVKEDRARDCVACVAAALYRQPQPALQQVEQRPVGRHQDRIVLAAYGQVHHKRRGDARRSLHDMPLLCIWASTPTDRGRRRGACAPSVPFLASRPVSGACPIAARLSRRSFRSAGSRARPLTTVRAPSVHLLRPERPSRDARSRSTGPGVATRLFAGAHGQTSCAELRSPPPDGHDESRAAPPPRGPSPGAVRVSRSARPNADPKADGFPAHSASELSAVPRRRGASPALRHRGICRFLKPGSPPRPRRGRDPSRVGAGRWRTSECRRGVMRDRVGFRKARRLVGDPGHAWAAERRGVWRWNGRAVGDRNSIVGGPN